MSYPSHKINGMVIQLLFCLDMGDCQEGDLIPFLMRELSVTRKTVRAAYQQARTIFDSRKVFDDKIAAASKGYELERIGRVERNVLRFALYELSSRTLQPRGMIISEALRLTRKFSTKEATAFVNALLDTIDMVEMEPSDGKGPALSPPKTETVE